MIQDVYKEVEVSCNCGHTRIISGFEQPTLFRDILDGKALFLKQCPTCQAIPVMKDGSILTFFEAIPRMNCPKCRKPISATPEAVTLWIASGRSTTPCNTRGCTGSLLLTQDGRQHAQAWFPPFRLHWPDRWWMY